MTDMKARVELNIKQFEGNESLLDMLETEAAQKLFHWGIGVAREIVEGTTALDDDQAEAHLQPRLKAVRQTMRAVGNWAAGKYSNAESLSQLKVALLENLQTIFNLPEESMSEPLERLLITAGDNQVTPDELIHKFDELIRKHV